MLKKIVYKINPINKMGAYVPPVTSYKRIDSSSLAVTR